MSSRDTTTIGIVGRLVGEASSWSGIPAQLEQGLRAHGFPTFTLSAELPPSLQARARRYLGLTSRLDASWAQTTELVLLRSALVRLRRRRNQPPGPVRWVQMGSEFGAPLPAGFVTLEDMTVASAARLPDFVGGPLRPGVARAWVRRQRRIYRRASVCCVASRWQAASLVRDYGVPMDRIRVVGFGQSLVAEPHDREWQTPRFLFVGLGWERKNGPRVIGAFRAVRKAWPTATLDVVGDHPPIDEPGVIGHGQLDHGDPADRARAVDLLQTATCFVLPSLYEPFGIAYAEAGAAGVGSIATSIGGARDAVGEEGGLFVDPRDNDEIAAAMLRFCDADYARRTGQAARRHAERLTWERVAARVATALGLPLAEGAEPPLVELDREDLSRFA